MKQSGKLTAVFERLAQARYTAAARIGARRPWHGTRGLVGPGAGARGPAGPTPPTARDPRLPLESVRLW